MGQNAPLAVTVDYASVHTGSTVGSLSMERVGLVVPTLNAGHGWEPWLDALETQEVMPGRLLVIDSDSDDETPVRAKARGFEVRSIARRDFNHGATRQKAIELLPECDVVVFLTQDARLAVPTAIEQLLRAFDDPGVGAAYGRQLPRPEAGPLEAHARLFNYGDTSEVRAMADGRRLGLRTAFISNSFAAYRREAMEQVGGFPTRVIMGEDTCLAGRMLLAGWRIAYQADATVYHSHGYSPLEEFRRYFDMGVLHCREPWLQDSFGRAEGAGRRFVFSEVQHVASRSKAAVPMVLLRNVLRYVGYKFGTWETRLPLSLKKRCSMHKRYWE